MQKLCVSYIFECNSSDPHYGGNRKYQSNTFFSYSSLNDNAVEGILRYAESTGKDVQIFDGNLLETLIVNE